MYENFRIDLVVGNDVDSTPSIASSLEMSSKNSKKNRVYRIRS